MRIGSNRGFRAMPCWLLLSILLGLLAGAPAEAADPVAIGIIQYNAKQGQSGWTPGGSLEKEVKLVADKIKDAANPVPVQFVSLVQAGSPSISDELAKQKIAGWKTVRGGCHGVGRDGNEYVEGAQIAYSPEWELAPIKGNPLSDSFDADNCFSPGRPYNIAYFQEKAKTDVKVLVVVVHPGHCYAYGQSGDLADLKACISKKHGLLEDFGKFDAEAHAATGAAPGAALKDLNVLIVGDTNELGTTGANQPTCPPYPGLPAGYELVFPNFGPLEVARLELGRNVCSVVSFNRNGTCCSNSSWEYDFDRVIVNHWAVKPMETIIKATAYPLFGGSEEHKAIYAVATFPPPK